MKQSIVLLCIKFLNRASQLIKGFIHSVYFHDLWGSDIHCSPTPPTPDTHTRTHTIFHTFIFYHFSSEPYTIACLASVICLKHIPYTLATGPLHILFHLTRITFSRYLYFGSSFPSCFCSNVYVVERSYT